MFIRNLIILLAMVTSLAGLTSCTGGVSSEDEARKLVAKYVNYIVPAYREGKLGDFVKVADGQALSMVDNTYNAYKIGGGMVLNAELQEMEFKDVVVGKNLNERSFEVVFDEEKKEWQEIYYTEETLVKTSEVWNYVWLDKKTFIPTSEEYRVSLDIVYTLDYVDEVLKVINVAIEREEILETIDTGAKWEDSVTKTSKMPIH